MMCAARLRRLLPGLWLTLAALLSAELLASALPRSAQAQTGVPLTHFQWAPTLRDGLALSDARTPGHLKWGVWLGADYANDLVVAEAVRGDAGSEFGALVAHQVRGELAAYLGIGDRWLLFAGLPATFWRHENFLQGIPEGRGTFPGDPRFGARFHFVDVADGLFSGALQLTGTIPFAHLLDNDQLYSGEANATLHSQLLFSQRFGIVTLRQNVGALVREETSLANLTAKHALTYGLGASVDLLDNHLAVYGEAFGSTHFEDFAERATSPLELLAGLRGFLPSGVVLGAGVGGGVLRGYGSPDVRAIVQVGYSPVAREEAPVVEAPEPAPEPAKEPVAPPPPVDTDGDGIPDDVDKCPEEPEDFDGFEDEDGCPDPDNDGDGIPDDVDECPDQPEDFDGFEDEDGCPDLDNDRDAVPDAEDKCPMTPGPASNDGCPKFITLNADEGRIELSQQIFFETGKSTLKATAYPVLEEIAGLLAADPKLRAVRIVGFTDSRGNDRRNMDLSIARASSVRDWIQGRVSQVPEVSGRLSITAWGCGVLHPIADNRTTIGREQNRRVEFEITDPKPEHPKLDLSGCRAAP